ncbi:MAG: hypothetical protein OXC30_02760 [Alphaproteobacteria bacterium]|nr:hypothetical protein [Alphaproteobacteria bacterium]
MCEKHQQEVELQKRNLGNLSEFVPSSLVGRGVLADQKGNVAKYERELEDTQSSLCSLVRQLDAFVYVEAFFCFALNFTIPYIYS